MGETRGLIWFTWSVWFNQTNETNQINKRDQPVLAHHAPRSVAYGKNVSRHAGVGRVRRSTFQYSARN